MRRSAAMSSTLISCGGPRPGCGMITFCPDSPAKALLMPAIANNPSPRSSQRFITLKTAVQENEGVLVRELPPAPSTSNAEAQGRNVRPCRSGSPDLGEFQGDEASQ